MCVPNVAAPTGQGISFNIRSVDPVLSYCITGLPNGLGLNSATGVISGAMPADAGAHEVKITASNGYGGRARNLPFIWWRNEEKE